MATDVRRVALMGATGSIGRQTLDVLRREKDELTLTSISAGRRVADLVAIAREFDVHHIGVPDAATALEVREILGGSCEVVVGDEGLAELSADADVVVNAVVGFAGLPVTMSALRAGRRLALANKESLVAAAPLVRTVRDRGEIVPVDSEHCAIHQCLRGASVTPGHPDVARLWLTASGGPFRGWSVEQLQAATRTDALRHPTWAMGEKITIDSSTLMNKGLEILEAAALFDVAVDRVGVVVHPQSIVHSMVEYVDGSTIAQLSNPDMRLPIAYALALPGRYHHAWGTLDLANALQLDFEPPDRVAFPALDLAFEAGRRGGAAPAWLSAANEIAVAAFLADEIRWVDIVSVVSYVMAKYEDDPLDTLDAVRANDAQARAVAEERIRQIH
jgi:1-deoxy-D-xylulose-5-phosphate reductoisomerase